MSPTGASLDTTAQISVAGLMRMTAAPIGVLAESLAALTLASAEAYLTQWLRPMSS